MRKLLALFLSWFKRDRMNITPADFWALGPKSAPDITSDKVRQIEERLDIKLPTELIALLKVRNGGYTKGFVFPTQKPTSWSENCVPFYEILDLEISHLEMTYFNSIEAQERRIPAKQILISGDGHFFISLDYRQSKNPSVAWIDTEMDEELQLANSFKEFMEGIVDEDTFEVK
jgi:hypothetical protein